MSVPNGGAGRLANRLRRYVRHAHALRGGYAFARSLTGQPSAPAPWTPGPANPLEDYFDAHEEGPGLWKWRHYFEVYDRHLRRFVGREVHLVEIGIYSGGSLGMWRHYFGPGAQLYGVDIEPACRAYEGDGVRVFIGDQADPGFWAEFLEAVPRIDVVVDDGGHAPHQQIATLKALLPHLASGGVYLCEDIHGPGHDFHAFVDGFTRPLHDIPAYIRSTPSPVHQHVSAVHRYPLITVIEKPETPVEAFEAPRRGSEWQPFIDPEELSLRATGR